MMLAIFPTLTCTVSLTLQKTMIMTVYNLYSDIELVSPMYFYNCETYYEYPEIMYIGTMMKIDFRFDSDQDEPGGILMYKVQRKETTRSDHQFSIDAISAKVIEEVTKRIRLLVAWKIERSGKPKVNIILVECDNETVLDKDKLAQLYDKIDNQPSRHYEFSERTWLMYPNTVLETAYWVVHEEGLGLNIIISDGIEDEDVMRPMWIDSTRQVSSPIVIYIVLIYIVSFTLQSVMNVTINNRCTNIELISPGIFYQRRNASHKISSTSKC
jgi:hypothetical protein